MDSIHFEKESKELLDGYKKVKALVNAHKPFNEEAAKHNRKMLDDNQMVTDSLQFTGDKVQKFEKRYEEEQTAKFKMSYDINCPHCSVKQKLKPLGEVKGADYLMYFRFYCPKCKKEFIPVRPNNDADLMIYYKNLLADIADSDKLIMRHGKVKVFKDSEIKNFRKLQQDLVNKVSKKNDLFINIGQSSDAFLGMVQTNNIWLEYVFNDIEKGVNTFGLKPNFFFDDTTNVIAAEKELFDSIKTAIETIEWGESKRDLSDLEKKNMLDEINTIKETLKTNIKNRENYFKDVEDMEMENWNREILSLCRKCNKEWETKPIGEMSSIDGERFFFFYCKDCKEKYADEIPNNIKDEVVFHERIIKKNFSNEQDIQKNLKLMQMTRKDLQAMRNRLVKLKKLDAERPAHVKGIKDSLADHDKWVRTNIERVKEIIQ